MYKVVGVSFRHQCKMYYFDPKGLKLKRGDKVIVNTQQGNEIGDVILAETEITDDQLKGELKRVIRIATEDDLNQLKLNEKNEITAVHQCREKVEALGLEMKPILAEYAFDRSKLTIYFTAEHRVDFRELVKELASLFRTRIELRQVGLRNETGLLGGIGPCGREFCCSTWLTDFPQISIKMAKEQNLSLNSPKISGCCGKLMCCLRHEQDVYADLNAKLPDLKSPVKTPSGEIGEVKAVNVLRQKVTVVIKKEKSDDVEIREYNASELQFKPSKKKMKQLSEAEEKELKKLEDQ